ncbi:hypothetical protein WA026_021501 [Henosepilachna vigintioctopunctata]|uniref:RZ-type domain-containing protein n=1 Tax=Henosepilachna vigintioctopunctata TaxID=420089 RepID=A0AAW1UPL1_9CUCU
MDLRRNNERGRDRYSRNRNALSSMRDLSSNTRSGSSNTRNDSPNTGNGFRNNRNGSSDTRNGSRGNRRDFVNPGVCNMKQETSTRRYHSAPREQERSDYYADKQKYRYRRDPFIGFKYLESLLEQPLEDTLSKLNSNQGFFDMLEKELKPDFIVVIIKVMGKVCNCKLLTLRNQVLRKSLNNTFLQRIQLYISGLAFQKEAQRRENSYFWRDPDSFWNNLAKACKTVLKVMPQYYCEALGTLLNNTVMIIPKIESLHEIHIADGIKNDFEELVQLVDSLSFEFEKEKPKVNAENIYEGEPPDNFRDIDVYPTTEELINDTKTFLRKNVVQGPYRDVEHYLDVQYRLLREDFVRPLKEGIQSYLGGSKARIQNVKIHHPVHFLQPITINEQFCALLKFEMKTQKTSFKYENSRRFMFGSLVCFTHDDFKSLIFGRIADRNEKYLKNGELVIGFDDNHSLIYKQNYIMVECGVYFEPYYHVLTVMKSLDEEDFPMKNYIIDVDTTSRVPNYITKNTIFELSRGSSTAVWQPFYVQEREFFNFNPSQNRAFVAALTRKFSIIQGPPGTGKTFVGLKIAQTLLHNLAAWNNRSPMLVICYTNHALDQFLEGLIKTTDKIVRIGGQSKNENLAKFNLRNHTRFGCHNLNQSRTTVKRLLSKIKIISDKLSMIKNFDCVLDIGDLKSVIPQFGNSWLSSANREYIFEWLLEINYQNQDDNRTRTAEVISESDELKIEVENVEAENHDDDYAENEYINNPIEDLLPSNILMESSTPLFSLNEVRRKIEVGTKYLNEMEGQLNVGNYDVVFKYENLKTEIDKLDLLYKNAKEKLDRAKQGLINQPANINVIESECIPKDERWNLYFYWLNLYNNSLVERYETLNKTFREAYKIYCESKDLEDIKILKSMEVIGMTTTAAARLHSSLKMIGSPIVIVEEAAEVLEAHIVTALTKDCQQLILIGDHQQLKPSTSSYQIEKFYNLGISLFERMILNDVQCFTLNVQHRMRPEISSLIKPAIYPNLEDHKSVLYRPKIKGIEKCLYFINHEYPEAENSGDTTKKNIHEVKFLIQLARYLILNGYKSEEITILAAYLGQMYEFQKERSKYGFLLKDIKITVLDNYQGEECDIILLSLVRNNSENRIGFLSIDNRVCVALSRARNGLYIMGNIKQLSDNSELWVKIKETLMRQSALGSSLALKCQIHGKISPMSKADDFSSVVEGGCDQMCGTLLSCHHNCQRLCHVYDREHKEYKCQEPCEKVNCDVDITHECPKKCYEDCGPCNYIVSKTLNCNHVADIPCYVDVDDYKCLTPVHVTLACGHKTDKPCHIDSHKYKCPFPCDTRLECGHSCVRKCHSFDDPDHLQYKCTKPCEKPGSGCETPELEGHGCRKLCWDQCSRCCVIVRKIRTKCSHQYDMECHRNVDEIECMKPCKRILPCGHKCKDLCDNPCGACTKKVKKVIPGCNHTITLPCYVDPDKSQCSGKCPRIMSCGHICESRCNEDCDPSKCKQMVGVSIKAKCGHTIEKIPCSTLSLFIIGSDEVKLESYCTFPCNEILNCSLENKHLCSGSCGACFQGRIHMRCSEKCGQILICNHECEIPCRETCKPCKKPCPFKCKHSVCKKKCGEPCSICTEACSRKCKHQKCDKRCGDICNIRPCEVPCEKKLKCGHLCVGFCGDPCPPLCRTCNKDVLEEIFFGTEDDEDARFVLLVDCGHVVESTGMESWLDSDKNEIKFKTCPKCKTTICTTQRYSDYNKLALVDILKVKVKHYGQKEEIAEKRKTLEKNILQLRMKLKSRMFIFNYLDIFLKYLDILRARLNEINSEGRAQTVNIVELNSIEIKYQLMEQIYNMYNKEMNDASIQIDAEGSKDIKSQTEFILSNLVRNTDDITTNEIENIEGEILRLSRIIQLNLIQGNRQIKPHMSSAADYRRRHNVTKQIMEVSSIIFSLSKYENTSDVIIKDQLIKLGKLLNPAINVTEAEKQAIVKAMGLKQGHWYKCENGHPYAIGECGGAMEVGICNECGVEIGGTDHCLLSTNAVATEMDGARHGAWSDAANMQNYDLQALL